MTKTVLFVEGKTDRDFFMPFLKNRYPLLKLTKDDTVVMGGHFAIYCK